MDAYKVVVVIPCYNEEAALPTLFTRLEQVNKTVDPARYDLTFFLVNDGSSDKTLEMLTQRCKEFDNANIINREMNGGFGAALKSGLNEAHGDFIVTIDADTNYDQLEIPKILDQMNDGIDIVTASPLHPDGEWNYPAHRFLTSRIVAWMYQMALGDKRQGLYTFTSGFRVYRGSIIHEIMPDANDFLATAELLINALLKDYKVIEYPTVVYDRVFGESKLKTVATAISHLKMIFRLFFNLKK